MTEGDEEVGELVGDSDPVEHGWLVGRILFTQKRRHQPIRRVLIPKEGGKTRPIGIQAFEDELVQDAVREVLEAIHEQGFLDGSYGFRPGRSPHDAVRTLDRIVHQGKVNWILEADIVSFFDSLDREKRMRCSGFGWPMGR